MLGIIILENKYYWYMGPTNQYNYKELGFDFLICDENNSFDKIPKDFYENLLNIKHIAESGNTTGLTKGFLSSYPYKHLFKNLR